MNFDETETVTVRNALSKCDRDNVGGERMEDLLDVFEAGYEAFGTLNIPVDERDTGIISLALEYDASIKEEQGLEALAEGRQEIAERVREE